MPKNTRRVRIFSALEVANICGVVNQTAINWIRNGHLKAFTTPGGQYRIYAKDLANFLEKRGMGDSEDALQIIMENANWKSVLIAESDPRTNAELKAELLSVFPDFTIFQAFDGFETGRKLTEEKPGIVLLDGDFPGMDTAKFVSTVKGDPVYGKPYLIIFNVEQCRTEIPQGVDAVYPKLPNIGKLAESLKSLDRGGAAANA